MFFLLTPLRKVGGVDEAMAQRADHGFCLGTHALGVELVQRPLQQVGAAVELEVEALSHGVGHRHLVEGVALAAAQQNPPGLWRDRLPVDRVHEVLAAERAELQCRVRVGPLDEGSKLLLKSLELVDKPIQPPAQV
jgi:hypothetical protein